MPQINPSTASTIGRLTFAAMIMLLALMFAPGQRAPFAGLSVLTSEAANKEAPPVAARSGMLTYTAAESVAGENRLTLRLSGDAVVLTDGQEAVLASRPLAETSEVVVNGSAGDDILVVDFSHGNPVPAGGLKFDGRAQVTKTGDGIVIQGGSFQKVVYDGYNAHDGRIVFDGSIINYAGLEPVTDSVVAADKVFNLPVDATNNQAILEDNGIAGDNISRLRSGNGSFESIDFVSPTNSLTINTGNDPTENVTVNNVDSLFTKPINLNGGTGANTFAFGNGATVKGGTITGGGGIDTLDYSAYTTGVFVNLGLTLNILNQLNLSGDQETPPNATAAFGGGQVLYDSTTRAVTINGGVSGLNPANITGFHLHRAPAGVAGPIIVNLQPTATITPAGDGFNYSVTFTLPADQEAAFLGGLTYINFHTPAFPGGEIRAQIVAENPFVSIGTGPSKATGTALNGVTGISNVIGGSGDDSLVGSVSSESLHGGPGNDTLLAGPNIDAMFGDGGNDSLLFNDGDIIGATEAMDGGAGTDLVNVNGIFNGNDNFTIFPGLTPGHVVLSSLYGLDIGTTETLTVSSYNGNDTFTIPANSLTGVTDLTAINFNGLNGNDIFNIAPNPTVAFTFNGGAPLPPTLPGDRLNVDTTGATNVTLTATNTAAGSSGTYTFGNRQPVNFTGVEGVSPTFLKVNDITVPEGNVGSTGATFNVSLEAPSTGAVSVDYATFNGTATAPSDYLDVNGTLSFATGQITRTVTVPVNGDTTPEGDETFSLNISNPSGAAIGDAQGVATITDDDAGGTLQFSASSYNVNESAGTVTITVNRTGSTIGALTVNYSTTNGTATAGLDYGNTSGTLFFGSGETSKTFDVPIINDTQSEGTETVNLSLSLPTGGAILGSPSTATLFILDDEAPPPPDLFAVTVNNLLLKLNANAPGTIISSVAITGLQSGENILNIDFRPATGQLYALGSTSRLYTINTTTGAATQVGSAGSFTLSGTDFGADFNPVVDRLRVVSDTEQNIRLNPNDGTLSGTDTPLAYASGDVNFGANPNVTGSAYTNNSAATATTTLYGIDSNLDVLVRQGGVEGTPSPNGGQLFTVGSLGVNTTGLTGFDIRQTSNTAYASLTSPGDTSSRLYTVNLSTGATTLIGTVGGAQLIRDIALAPAGSFQFASATASVAENAGKLTVTINRTGNTTGTATVNVATADGTATQKGDYTIRLATVTFNPGDTSKTVDVFITDDGYVESPETFAITLSAPTGDFTLDGGTTETVTITDNDASSSNPIALTNFFVRQHYIDFLNREPEPPGFNAWVAILNGCAPGNTSCDRVEVSSAFYRSDEFQVRGYFLYRFYRASLGRNPSFREFMMDLSRTTGFLTDAQLEAAKVAFVDDFMSRSEFKAKYDATTDPAAYVSLIEQTAGVTLSNRQALITGLTNGTETRATVLRKAMESPEVAAKFFNEGFVVEAYFGYLRRDPDGAFAGWVNLLNTTNNSRVIVNGFVNSNEYVQRFGP